MKKRIALGILVATVALGGTAFAEGGALDREVQKLFEWSIQAVEAAKKMALTAGPGAQPAAQVPPVMMDRIYVTK
ncbi:MAG: hypothetical protein ACREJI_06905 [Candidatus Methylomirabilales bacterium]